MDEPMESVIDVVLTNDYPNIQGFGLDIAGGVDRPYIKEDDGIFISALKEGGLAQKSDMLSVGDQIIAVNDQLVSGLKHDEVVKLFLADKTRVSLRVHLHKLDLIRAAARSPSGSRSVASPHRPSPPPEPDHTAISLSGFLLGIALGCVSVVLIRRYLTSTGKL